MNKNTEKLKELIKENPDLPIVPMVYYQVVGEDYGNWVGEFSTCYVGEYALFYEKFYDDREEFKEDYYNYCEEEINEKCSYDPTLELPIKPTGITQEQIKANKIASANVDKFLKDKADEYFKKAIIVYIDTLD